MKPLLYLFGPALAAVMAPAQELLWQIPGPAPSWMLHLEMSPFIDFDGDGYRDFLHRAPINPFSGTMDISIRSGKDASILLTTQRFGVIAMQLGGDFDNDGRAEVVLHQNLGGGHRIEVWSPSTDTILWDVVAPLAFAGFYGEVLLGNIDLNGDGNSDLLVATSDISHSTVWAYDHTGTLLYTIPCLQQGRVAASICNMGDMNGDGCEDFVLGVGGPGSGAMVLTSGIDGSDIRVSYGFTNGDRLSAHATNLGDIDGDGVNDYMGFPTLFSSTFLVAQFSGATGNVIRFWYDYTDSVIAGPDFDLDLDGVPDLVLGSNGFVSMNLYGLVRAFSGRDGTELWQVQNTYPVPGSGTSHGSTGFARYAADLGVQPGRSYPSIAWIDLDYWTAGSAPGRVRAWHTALAGQGPITGTPCSNTGSLPQIGARNTAAGNARVTVSKAPPNAFALLVLSSARSKVADGPSLSLTPFGLVGCDLLVAPDTHYLSITGTSGIDHGYAAVDLPFAFTPASLGTTVAAQWLVFDPQTLNYATTARHELRGQ